MIPGKIFYVWVAFAGYWMNYVQIHANIRIMSRFRGATPYIFRTYLRVFAHNSSNIWQMQPTHRIFFQGSLFNRSIFYVFVGDSNLTSYLINGLQPPSPLPTSHQPRQATRQSHLFVLFALFCLLGPFLFWGCHKPTEDPSFCGWHRPHNTTCVFF